MTYQLYRQFGKRACDVLVSGLLIVLLSPLLLAVAVAVRVFLGKPVFYRQVRAGYLGRPFTIYKFRTMTSACDEAGQLLSDAERLTRFGVFLRSTSLDELPELWNVLRGDMSLVGPRPLLMEYLERYNEEQSRRHEVKPGVTGLAQVQGRNAISWEARFAYDVEYVDRLTTRLDLRILFATVACVLRREGISADAHATCPVFQGTQSAPEATLRRAA